MTDTKHIPPPPPKIPGTKVLGNDIRLLQNDVAKLLGRDNIRFPGAQPVSFSAKHLEELTTQDYLVCEKSDGIRCLMYMAANSENVEEVFLIDRKNDYYHLEGIHFPRPGDFTAFHTNTIIDGELVNELQENGEIVMKYLVFDCLVFDGQPLLNRILDKRHGYLADNICKPFIKCLEEYPEERQYLPFDVKFKTMQRAYGLQRMFTEILPTLTHGNDGLIFTSRNSHYHPGTDPNIIKWKPPEENSVDFRLYMEFPPLSPPSSPDETSRTNGTQPHIHLDYFAQPIFHLAVGTNNNVEARYSTLYVTPSEFETLKSLNRQLEQAIIECYQDSQHRWRFMRVRDDKNDPNHISTVDKVMESIRDRITKEDLIANEKRIRHAWKAREAREREEAIAAVSGRKGADDG